MQLPSRPLSVAAVDACCVLGFVALGRNTHDEGSALGGTVRVAAPFLLALAAVWIAGRPRWRAAAGIPFGATVWAVTVVGGMVLRRFVFDRGTATPFVIVASCFLCATLVGWRAVRLLIARSGALRRAAR